MHRVKPVVFCVGETRANKDEMRAYLTHIGAPDWETDAPTEVEEIIEVMARGCYKSFGPGLNPNVTRVRPDNKSHLGNLVKVGHGSTMEHSFVNFMFCDVSRVFTHELVRHRAGTAISQESLRFVRLEDMGVWVPPSFEGNDRAEKLFEETWGILEQKYGELIDIAADIEGRPFEDLPFHLKKKYTSAARRLAPIGLATNIGWSCNIRTLRHVIEMRTAPSSEEEIRVVFAKVAEIAMEKWGNILGDYYVEMADGLPYYRTEHPKV